MKTINNISSSILSLIIFVIVLASMTSCEKEEENNSAKNNNVSTFSFDFVAYNSSIENNYIQVNFASSDIIEIPTVIVNTVEINKFKILGDLCLVEFLIPFSKEINYSVTANGKSANGHINMPDQNIKNVFCNGDSITIASSNFYNTNLITPAEQYQFSWDNAPCDFQTIDIDDWADDQLIYIPNTETSTIINKEDIQHNYFNLNHILVNGYKGNSGVGPNVNSDYGNGYVSARLIQRMSCRINEDRKNNKVINN